MFEEQCQVEENSSQGAEGGKEKRIFFSVLRAPFQGGAQFLPLDLDHVAVLGSYSAPRAANEPDASQAARPALAAMMQSFVDGARLHTPWLGEPAEMNGQNAQPENLPGVMEV